MNNINDNIRNFRIKKDMTQQFLADKLFVTRQCVSRWEQGKTLPDIESLEKLANIFECSINDLIDDNSVKSITIEEAITNKKKTKFTLLSLAFSLLAIVLTGFSLYYSSRENNDGQRYTFIRAFGYIESIDSENGLISFEGSFANVDLPPYKFLEDDAAINDNRGDSISISELKLNDKVLISYEPNFDFLEILVIDSEIGEALFGVFVSGTQEEYNSLEELRNEMMGINYVVRTSEHEETCLTGTYALSDISEKYYYESIYDVYLSLNPFFVTNDLEIGLITSNGLRVVETIDPLEQPDQFSFSGEYAIDGADPDEIESNNVTYNIHIDWVFPYISLEIFEYDKNGSLINEATVITLGELRSFEADPDALRCLVKENKTIKTGNGDVDQAVVFELLLGEKLKVDQADDYGAVTDEWFWYK